MYKLNELMVKKKIYIKHTETFLVATNKKKNYNHMCKYHQSLSKFSRTCSTGTRYLQILLVYVMDTTAAC